MIKDNDKSPIQYENWENWGQLCVPQVENWEHNTYLPVFYQ